MFNWRQMDVQLNAIYQAKRSFVELADEEQGKNEIYAKDKNGKNFSSSWHTLNFKSMYRFSDRYVVNAGIENITNRRYWYYSSGISERGRNFIFSLQANF